MLEWNVYYFNFNRKKIEKFNVFSHCGFLDDCKKIARKHKDDKLLFTEALKRSLMYYFWARCEWEVVICGYPDGYFDIMRKVDVYEQVMGNWEHFSNYVWDHSAELRRREKKTNGGRQSARV